MRLAPAAAALLACFATAATAAVLDRVRETGELRIGYRDDAEPFSYRNVQGQAAGYSVDLCRAVAQVAATDRFAAVADGKVDLLCEATTVTLDRRSELDFSLLTFATGATLIYPAD